MYGLFISDREANPESEDPSLQVAFDSYKKTKGVEYCTRTRVNLIPSDDFGKPGEDPKPSKMDLDDLMDNLLNNGLSLKKKDKDGVVSEMSQAEMVKALEAKQAADKELKQMHFQFWDIGGQDNIGSIARVYFKATSVALLVCDHEDIDYDLLLKYKNDFDSKTQEPTPIILVISKIDTRQEGLALNEAELDEFTTKNGFGYVPRFYDPTQKELEALAVPPRGWIAVSSLLESVQDPEEIMLPEAKARGQHPGVVNLCVHIREMTAKIEEVLMNAQAKGQMASGASQQQDCVCSIM